MAEVNSHKSPHSKRILQMDTEKETTQFLKENPKIKEAMDLFRISQDQYLKALKSLRAGSFTSDSTNCFIEPDTSCKNQ